MAAAIALVAVGIVAAVFLRPREEPRAAEPPHVGQTVLPASATPAPTQAAPTASSAASEPAAQPSASAAPASPAASTPKPTTRPTARPSAPPAKSGDAPLEIRRER